jgi:sugar (pentulose or hexulose) kinase
MTKTHNFVAFDLGASSGRAVLGRFDGQTLSLEEMHRFHNGPTRVLDSIHWNALQLFTEMKTGLAKAAEATGGDIAAVGIDTWGVDFGLLDKSGALIGNPYHYRDSRTDGVMDRTFEIVPQAEVFMQTGIQFMQLNSLFQLVAMALHQSPALAAADTLLFMPDLFNYWFTGQKMCEYTIASTSQAYNMQENCWATEMLAKLDIPTHIFLDVVPPGAKVGTILPDIAQEAGLSGPVPVIAPGGHDTACAVASVPVADADQERFAYLSSGTWSLLGVELPAPVINEKSLEYNVTNEGGVENTIRLLKNLGGLWLVQECRRTWAQQGEDYSWADLTRMAAEAPPFVAVIDPDDATFLPPGDMGARIVEFCRRTGQPAPASKGGIIRVALESLALKYRWVTEKLEELAERPIEVIHIVGGGTQNTLLNQFAANATCRRIITGPIEATAIGNMLMQMLAVGQISSLSEGREVVKRSFPVESYQPADSVAWEEAYGRLLALLG